MTYFRKIKQNLQAGFSLVELLIVIGLMSVLLMVLTDMFTAVLDVQTESESHSAVTEDGRFILARLSYDIQRASVVAIPEDLDVTISSSTSTSFTVDWTTVNSSDSQVQYGATSSYGSQTTLNPSLVTAHSVNVTGLTAGTTYHFRTLSRDSGGNLTTSADYVFVTTGGSGSVAHVQTAADYTFASFSSTNKAFTSNVTAGNLVVASVMASAPSATTVTCTDTLGNSYTTVTLSFDATYDVFAAVCYTISATGGANTVTATFSQAAVFRHIIINEYSGISQTNPIDVTAKNIGLATTAVDNATSTAATTTVNGDLIYGALFMDDDTGVIPISAGTGFTQRNSLNSKDMAVQDRVQSTAGSIASTQTFGGPRGYIAHMVAFKAAPAGAITPQLGATSQTMSLTIGGSNVYSLSGGNLQLVNALGTNNLNSSETTISDLTFQRIGNVGQDPTVRINFTVTSVARAKQGTNSRTFTTTVGPR